MVEDLSSPVYALGGEVTGLVGEVVLAHGDATLSLDHNGPFQFPLAIAAGTPYTVEVARQPFDQLCEVRGGQGVMPSAAVTDVQVSCSTSAPLYLGGSVSNLGANRTLSLQLNGQSPALTLTASGAFSFPGPVVLGAAYTVAILAQPAGQICALSGGTGTVGSNVATAVTLICSDKPYKLSVQVTGLTANARLTLTNGGADALSISKNGTAAFATQLVYGQPYLVAVESQPTGQLCSVSQGSGTVVADTIPSPTVTCVNQAYPVGGSLTGLLNNGTLVLNDNGGDPLTLAQDGNFTFATNVVYQNTYSVSVATQPTGQTCTLTQNVGTMPAGGVTGVAVTCSSNTYPVGGSVSGLASGGSLVLTNNGADARTLTANGSFSMPTAVAYQGTYNIAVATQPTGQTCTVSQGSGTVGAGAVTTIAVACSNNTYTVGGSLSGLLSGNSAVLTDNGADNLTLSQNGNFTFATAVAYQSPYAVAVATQPTGQTCTVSGGSGSMGAANVTAAAVSCSKNNYKVGVVISGLTSPMTLTDGTDQLTVVTNGNAAFATALPYQSTYSVNVVSQPSTATCTLSNSSGLSVPAQASYQTAVACTGYTLGGTVSGLTGGTVTLGTGSQTITLAANGNFILANTVPPNSTYSVSITAQYAQACTLTNGAGTATANVTNLTVACQQKLAFATGQGASGVLSQPSYTSASAGTSASSMRGTAGAMYLDANGILFIGENTNSRIMGYPGGLPAGPRQVSATILVGQPTFTSSTAAASATQFAGVTGLWASPTTWLVAEGTNQRVTVFASPPTGVGTAAATGVIGQPNFTSASHTCTATGLYGPKSAIMAGNAVVVADTSNNRVLIWNSLANATSQQAPNVILGQTSATSCTSHTGAATALSAPFAPYWDGTQLFVTDQSNNRVLVWRNFAGLVTGQGADFAIGQPDLVTTTSNCTTTGMKTPQGLVGNGTQLFVVDTGNNRVLIYNTVPTASGAAADAILGSASCTSGVSQTTFNNPTGVSILANSLGITEYGNNRASFYTSQ